MKFRVYIVDDSTTVRNSLSETLEELAHIEPVGATDTEHEAKRWLGANDWDLAIIDLFLREGSGMNVLQAVRKARPEQRIVVLSNHSSPDVRWRCRQLGADAVFDKSTEIEALVDYCVASREPGPAEASPEKPPAAQAAVQPAT
ncbi:MAG TPA: response regulator transcription factor [Ramlibacter sp.]|nr:response regulator transcription factor [Ramlibacter sp.]